MSGIMTFLGRVGRRLKNGLGHHWIALVIILFCTLFFFWPIATRMSSYSEGGDAMFNAWILARDQHCILREGCPKYSDANIYFPHKDTMLYSETELSAGALTLPLYAINKNPIFSYNVWTIASFLFSGLFMYLLAMYLSKGNKYYSILAGLVFEFAPVKISSIGHLQNLSIFYLPLIVLLTLKYLEHPFRKYLWLLLLALVLQFYASWYQMVFVLVVMGVFLGAYLIFKLTDWRKVVTLSLVILLAIMATLPLALQYTRFSKTSKATFGVVDQTTYSSSISDYVAPFQGTIIGNLYRKEAHLFPHLNSYNPDSASYHSMTLYAVALFVLVMAYRRRKKSNAENRQYKFVLVLALLAVVGFVLSLGPLLKVTSSYTYGTLSNGVKIAFPLPYLLVDKFLPQLSFIRAIGRISVLVLFALCCALALVPEYLGRTKFTKQHKQWLHYGVAVLLIIELMPLHMTHMFPQAYHYNLKIPAVP